MDESLTRFTSFEDAKADEYRYWQSRTMQERLDAAAELSLSQYQCKEPMRDVHERLQRTLVRVQRAPVKYLIVGGYAVAIHAQPRASKDLDIFVQPEPKNAEAVYAALAKFGAPMVDLKPAA